WHRRPLRDPRGGQKTTNALTLKCAWTIPMRVLFLTSYFPLPSKPLIGTWALEQGRALASMAELRVACCTPYLPRVLGIVPKARVWSGVPRKYTWPAATGGDAPATAEVKTFYLRGLFYPLSPFKGWAYPAPLRQMNLAWRSIRGRLVRIVDQFKPEVVFAHH